MQEEAGAFGLSGLSRLSSPFFWQDGKTNQMNQINQTDH